MSYLYETKRRGKRARRWRDRERECEREGGLLQAEVASVVKKGRWRNRPFGISQDQNRRITLIARNYFNDIDRLFGLWIF